MRYAVSPQGQRTPFPKNEQDPVLDIALKNNWTHRSLLVSGRFLSVFLARNRVPVALCKLAPHAHIHTRHPPTTTTTTTVTSIFHSSSPHHQLTHLPPPLGTVLHARSITVVLAPQFYLPAFTNTQRSVEQAGKFATFEKKNSPLYIHAKCTVAEEHSSFDLRIFYHVQGDVMVKCYVEITFCE